MWSKIPKRKILAKIVGYFCIGVFFSLTTYIVYVFYSYIAPSILDNEAYGKFIFHFIFGNWIAINIYFHFIMAWLTSPGLSKNYQTLSTQFPKCQKCLLHKLPRTHHCRWCDSCILKYDHHCPWLNNCVGFYNHRYFYQFCCFMSLGCFYAGLFGYREYQISIFDMQVFRHIDSFLMAPDILYTLGVEGFITYYIFIIALGMGFILLGISYWHGRLISRGQTTIEYMLDDDDEQNISRLENWKQFLGVSNMKEFIRRILLPSRHKPKDDRITIEDKQIDTDAKANKHHAE